jgi:hypothetical protein
VNNLTIHLANNALKKLPRFYGNVSRLHILAMPSQSNLDQLEDYFFDNSIPFEMDNKVEKNLSRTQQ